MQIVRPYKGRQSISRCWAACCRRKVTAQVHLCSLFSSPARHAADVRLAGHRLSRILLCIGRQSEYQTSEAHRSRKTSPWIRPNIDMPQGRKAPLWCRPRIIGEACTKRTGVTSRIFEIRALPAPMPLRARMPPGSSWVCIAQLPILEDISRVVAMAPRSVGDILQRERHGEGS